MNVKTIHQAPALPTGLHRWMIALCATLGTWSYSFVWNSVGVALPNMKGTFAATNDQIIWVMIAFVVGGALMTASLGWLSGRLGRRNLYLLSLAGFCISLIGCGSATTLESETFWRFIQGLTGAPMLTLGQILVVNAFPPERYTQATSIWALGFVTGNLVAPTLGGALIDQFGWQWIFYTNIPLGLAILLIAWLNVPDTPKSAKKLDWIGFFSLIACVALLQFMFARGERLDWFTSKEILIEAGLAFIFAYIFVVHMLTSKETYIDKSLFRDRNFALGQIFIFIMGAVIYLPLLLLPLMLQQINGYPASEIGNLLFARGIGSILSLLLMSQLRERIDPRLVIFVGLVLTAYPGWEMAHWTPEVRPFDVMWLNAIQGVGTGFIWAPLNRLVLSRLSGAQQDQGFALFYLNFDIGNAFGTSLIIALHTRDTQTYRAVLSEHVNSFNEIFNYPSIAGAWSRSSLSDLAMLEAEVTRQAAMIAYNKSYLLIFAMTAMMVLLIFLLKPAKPQTQNKSVI